ncbi:hypothetical protein ACG04Q_19280 [Roseateles sp. DXS20W]|uniref:Uncharacterized protein n=1 Tax=Pelomonas lactea TaxID=3299030 RepID=A0ABW7GPQ2_9BURK
MRATVRPINVRGRPLRSSERKATQEYVGVIRMREERNNQLGRAFVQAELVSAIDGQQGQVLPPLIDARVLYWKGKNLRVTGMEVVEDLQYYQTWDVECT